MSSSRPAPGSQRVRAALVLLALAATALPGAAFAQQPGALQFNGTNQYVTFGSASALGASTFTIEVRFKRTATGAPTSTGSGGIASAVPLLTKGRAEQESPANLNMNWFLGINTSNNALCVDFEDTAGGVNHPLTGTTPIVDNVWYHAAATCDGTTLKLYLNGNLEASLVVNATPEATSIQHAALASALTSSGAAAGFFAGILDEARVWNVVRNATDISANQNVEIQTAPGLVGHWALNEGAGAGAGNSVPTGPNGTLTATPTWSTDSTVPLLPATALRFGGAPTGYVTFGDPAALDLAQFTVECWFRRDGAGTPNSTGGGGVTAVPLIAHGGPEAETPTNVNMNYFLGIRSDGVLCADFEEGAAGTSPGLNHPVSGTTVISNGTWYHAAATYDGTTWRLYLNGSLEATLAVGQPVESGTIQHASLGTTLQSSGSPPASNSLWFNGAIDEARVWNSARSQAAIISTMNSELSAPVSGLVARWGLNEDALTTASNSAGSVINGAVTGTNWSWAAGSPFNAPVPPTPDPPTGLSATAITTTRIDLAWTDVATNETGYEVERSTTGVGGTYSLLVSLPAGSTAYSNTGLAVSTEYCYRVRAVGLGGNSAYAGPQCATTLTPTPPATPSGLVATAPTFSQVHLAWTDNASTETGYEVERSTTGIGGAYSLIATLGADAIAYDDNGRTPSTETCYRVRATNGSGPSGYAGPACATTPGSALDFGPAGATYVTFGDPAALDLATFTIECWFRRDGAGTAISTGTNGVTAVPMVTHGAPESDGSTVDANWFLGIRASDGVLCADFEEGAGGATPGSNHPVAGVTPVGAGWHHAAATYDGTTWMLYLDGNLEATLVVGQPVRSNTIQQAALATALTSTGGTNGFFDGALDEVRVWSSVRTQAEIQSTANLPIAAATSGLVARWALDEGSGTAVNGSAGTTVNGTITGANYAWVAAAPFNLSFTPPGAPSGLSATAVTHTLVMLAWTDNATNEASFQVERSTSGIGGTYTLLATLPPNTTGYADPALTPSSEYCYRVRAVNGSGSSSYAGPQCATTPAPFNTAFDFNGGTYASFGNPAALQLSALTIEMWIRRDGAGTGTNTGTGGIPDAIPLFAKGRAEAETATQDINYLLGIRASDGVLCADFEEGAGGASPSLNHPIAGATPIAIGGWHHVAATYDGTTWKLYLDGMLDAALPVGQPLASASTVAASLGSALLSTGVAAGFFDGAVDEVRVWNVARTEAEIQSTANARITSATPGLVARWGLDEGSGSTVGGSAGTSINGTLTGTTSSWASGAPFDLAFNDPPAVPILIAPADGATGVSTSPSLSVQVSDPDGTPVDVTFYGRPAAGSPGPDFTLIGLPDTQYYTGELNGGTNAMFQAQTNWIVNNRVARNIVYVGQLGDCTEHGDNGGNNVEWVRADASLSILENPLTTGLPQGIPFGVCVGNHDQSPIGTPDGASTVFYNQYFGVSRFTGRTYYGGNYGSNNDNWYELFSASGMDFIVISFEYDPTPDAAVLAWADGLLTTYASRRAIVMSHFICNTGNPAGFGPQGQGIYDALKSHTNLDLMLCGHVPGEGRRQDTFAGHTTHTLLSDYQSRTRGGDGWLRILEFSPTNNVIRVRTYSPTLGQFEADADSSSQFTLPYEMVSAPAFTAIGTVSGVASGGTASLPWPALTPGSAYEWYATVNDGATTTIGPVWHFTTGAASSYTLTVAATPSAGGSVAKDPDLASYASGATVNVTATANAGYHFVNWTGDATGSANPVAVLMNANKSVTAVFDVNPAVPAPANFTATPPTVIATPGPTFAIALGWDAVPAGTTVEVWRAPYGTYPEYGPGSPPVPSATYPPGAGWELTGVTTPGAGDLTPVRGYYRYVAYARDVYGTWSPASSPTAGTLNYRLGDVAGPPENPTGDGRVTTADVSQLGASYGLSGPAVAPVHHLDVGPTSNGWVDGRPTPDDNIEFEDLVVFALNFEDPLAPSLKHDTRTLADASGNELVLVAPANVAPGEPVTVTLGLRGPGSLKALSMRLRWDPAVVAPVEHRAASWLTQQSGVAFSAKPGAVDAAFLRAPSPSGGGELATVTFRTLAAGDPGIRIDFAEGRDERNRAVAVDYHAGTAASGAPVATRLAPARPNPFREGTTLSFSLAAAGPVQLVLYSVDGRMVRTLVRDVRPAGEHTITWEGRDDDGNTMLPGVYYAQLVTQQGRFRRTLTLLP